MNSDKKFEQLFDQFTSSVNKMSETLVRDIEKIDYNELSTENKIKYDLYQAYSINGLLWSYLRTTGQDPSKTIVKTELSRIKEYMSELQRTVDRRTIMPRIDQGAAKRFIRHGLWDPNETVAKKSKKN